jgi:copper chaperone
MSTPYTLSVPDMSCGHCRASITTALAPLDADLSFDMEARRLSLSGRSDAPAVIAALDSIGFDAVQVAD